RSHAARVLKNGSAHATPGVERTRLRSASLRLRVSETHLRYGSVTQRSGCETFCRGPVAWSMRPRKIAPCCVISRTANERPKTSERYLARSPRSMRSAIRTMGAPGDGLSVDAILDRPPHGWSPEGGPGPS